MEVVTEQKNDYQLLLTGIATGFTHARRRERKQKTNDLETGEWG